MQPPPEPVTNDAVATSALCREHGHALKNIFSIIIANAEMIGEELASSLMHRRLERIIEASRRGEQLVEQIRANSSTTLTIAAEPLTEAAMPAAPLRGRVLVVDDEPDVVEIIVRYLSKEG